MQMLVAAVLGMLYHFLTAEYYFRSVLQAKQIISMIITVTEKVFQRKNFGSLTDKLFCSLLSLFQSNVESAGDYIP